MILVPANCKNHNFDVYNKSHSGILDMISPSMVITYGIVYLLSTVISID